MNNRKFPFAANYDYSVNPENGAGMLNVVFANAVDALASVLGEFSELSATTATRRKTAKIIETGEEIPMKIADQIAVTGILQNGAVASVHFRGGHLSGTNFFWEILEIPAEYNLVPNKN